MTFQQIKMADEPSPSLALIFIASLQQGKTPQDWKKALVMLLFKKGTKLILQIITQCL